LRLRLDSHAQSEIREYANAIYDIIKPLVPAVCEAYEDYVLGSVTLSRLEIEKINNLLLKRKVEMFVSKEEESNFQKKLKRLGIPI